MNVTSGPGTGPGTALEVVVFGAAGVVTKRLPPEGTVSLGRSDENDVQVEDSSVSRRHAVIHVGPPLRIEDLGSANGTRVRREEGASKTAELVELRLQRGQAVEFAPGEAIILGSTLLVVRRCDAAGARAEPGRAKAGPIVRDEEMKRLHELAARVAQGPINVLLLGETGAGKEVLAEAIHRHSPRAAGPFLRLNCAALSESLLESELFGHEKGAFTGALRQKPGLFESAEGGTVLLDEVGELPLGIQAKLLRVLEDRQVMRVGSLTPRPIDVRFVSATNRDLAAEVERGTFRQDLYFRLNGIALTVPPLRERPSEIAPLAEVFAARAASALGRSAPSLSAEAVAVLEAHRWPGNVRELRNVIERAVVLCHGSELLPEHLLLEVERRGALPVAEQTLASAPSANLKQEIDSLERRRILDALEQCAGNQTQAAALLGMPRRTLVKRLTAYDIPRPRKRR